MTKFTTDMEKTENKFGKIFFTTDLESATFGDLYKLEDCLRKGLIRAKLSCKEHEIYLEKRGEYGDKDLILFVEELRCSDSLWCESVSFTITGEIPLHVTGAGKLSLGFGVGDDVESWKRNRSIKAPALVMCFQPGTNKFNSIDIVELLQSDSAKEVLLRVLQRFLAEESLKTKKRREI